MPFIWLEAPECNDKKILKDYSQVFLSVFFVLYILYKKHLCLSENQDQGQGEADIKFKRNFWK